MMRIIQSRAAAIAVALGALVLFTAQSFLGYGVDANIPNIQTTNYQIAPTDCQKTVQVGTGSTGQHTITLPVITGFPSNCSVLIKNGDTASGKILSGFPSDVYAKLYPRQSLGVKIINGAWQAFYKPAPWTPTSGSFTLFASTTGNDTTNDCLSTATSCTLPGICLARNVIFQNGPVTISVADGTYTAQDGNNAFCSVLGNNGANSPALTFVTGDCTTPTNVVLQIPLNAAGFYVKDGGEVEISCLEMTGGNGARGIENSGQGAVVDYDKVTWGTWGTAGVHISIATGGFVTLGADGETITGNFTSSFHIATSGNANYTAGGNTNIPSAVSWSGGDWLAVSGGSALIDLSGWATAGSGVGGSTGAQAALVGPGFLLTASNAPCASVLPGSGGCSLLSGFQDSANDASTFSPFSTPEIVNGVTSAGTTPTCSVTGAGSSGSCALATGSNDFVGRLLITAGGSSITSTGTVTLTLAAGLGSHDAGCVLQAASGTGTWTPPVTFVNTTLSSTAPVWTWTNASTSLTTSDVYGVNYLCAGY